MKTTGVPVFRPKVYSSLCFYKALSMTRPDQPPRAGILNGWPPQCNVPVPGAQICETKPLLVIGNGTALSRLNKYVRKWWPLVHRAPKLFWTLKAITSTVSDHSSFKAIVVPSCL